MITTKAKAARMLQHSDGREVKVVSFLPSQCTTGNQHMSTEFERKI